MTGAPDSVRHCLEFAAEAAARAAVDGRIASSQAIAQHERLVLQSTASRHRRSALVHERSATSIMSSLSRLSRPFALPAQWPAKRSSIDEPWGSRLAEYLTAADVRTQERPRQSLFGQLMRKSDQAFRSG